MFTANVRNRFAAFLLLEDADNLALRVIAVFSYAFPFKKLHFVFLSATIFGEAFRPNPIWGLACCVAVRRHR
jgi:hypothetical protein